MSTPPVSSPAQQLGTAKRGSPLGQVVRVETFPTSPWPSGGGSTRVIAVAPGSSPAWRVSVATVEDGAVFSLLPGIRRVHLPLQAGGTVLFSEGLPLPVSADGSVRFDGSLAVTARVPGGQTLALNVMTTTDGPTTELRHERATGPWTSRHRHTVCVLVRSGSVTTVSGLTDRAPAVVPAGCSVQADDAELVEIVLAPPTGTGGGQP